MAERALRSVPANEVAEPKSKPNVQQAVAQHDRRGELEAMQARLAKALDDPQTPARDLTPLSRLLREIGRELESLIQEGGNGDGSGTPAPDEAFDGSA